MPTCDGDVCVMDEPVIERQAGVPVLTPAVRATLITGSATPNRIPFMRGGRAPMAEVKAAGIISASTENAYAAMYHLGRDAELFTNESDTKIIGYTDAQHIRHNTPAYPPNQANRAVSSGGSSSLAAPTGFPGEIMDWNNLSAAEQQQWYVNLGLRRTSDSTGGLNNRGFSASERIDKFSNDISDNTTGIKGITTTSDADYAAQLGITEAEAHNLRDPSSSFVMNAASTAPTATAASDPDGYTSVKLADIARDRANEANAINWGAPATAQTGLSTAQTSLITGGIASGVTAIGQILNFVGQNASRDQQLQMAQMQADLQRGNQDMQAAQAAGNRALQLQLAQMQNDRLNAAAQLAANAGASDTAQQLQLLRRQNQELIAGQRVSTHALQSDNGSDNTGIPTWALIAGTVAFVALGAGVIYWVATKDDKAEAEEYEYPRTLAARRLSNKRSLYRSY